MEQLKKIVITKNTTIRHALKQMDATGKKILVVADKRNAVLGVITDGNIRRWIIKGGDLTESVSKIMSKSPVTLKEGYSQEQAKRLMLDKGIDCIPIVNKAGALVSAIWWSE